MKYKRGSNSAKWKNDHRGTLFKNYKAHYACVVKKKMTKSEFLTWSDLAVEFCDVAITGKIGIDECEEKIKENVERLTFETKKEQQIKVTLSGGIYICNEYTLSFDSAIQFANHALYRAKLLGRNCIMSYSLGDNK